MKDQKERMIIEEPMSTAESVKDRLRSMDGQEYVLTVPIGELEEYEDG